MRSFLLAFGFLLLSCTGLYAQRTIHYNNQSHFVYVFRLDTNDMERYMQLGDIYRLDSSFCHTVVDSFPVDSFYNRQLSPGYYLFAYAWNVRLQQQIVHFSKLDIRTVSDGRNFDLAIHDKVSGMLIRDALVEAGSGPIPFDSATGTYHCAKIKKHHYVRIRAGGEVAWFSVKKEKNESENGYRAHGADYIAFNKPKYLPGDTVKLKIYVQRKGKLYNKKAVLDITRDWSYNEPHDKINVVHRQIEPSKPGVFTYQFVLGDSLMIDHHYIVKLIKKDRKKSWKEKQLTTGRFLLEDYQLDEMHCTVAAGQAEFGPGDSVVLRLEAHDANDLRVPDARVQLRINVSTIEQVSGAKTFIPFETYALDRALDPDGPTRIALSPQLFATADAQYKVQALFANSNNETSRDSCTFSVRQQTRTIITKMSGDTITATYFENGKAVAANGKMWIVEQGDTIAPKTIGFPCTFIRQPLITGYLFMCGKTIQHFTPAENWLNLESKRTNDSVLLELVNPGNLPVTYELFRGKEKIRSGNGTVFSYKAADATKEIYRFTYRYFTGEKTKTWTETIRPATQTLNVQVEQPKQVFPGQKATIQVKVTDFEGRPVKDADVTASSVNAQFKENSEPPFTDFNTLPGLKKKKLIQYTISSIQHSPVSYPDNWWARQLRLDTVHDFALRSPGNKLYLRYFKLKDDAAQFTPFLASHGAFYGLCFIYVDDVPVYINVGELNGIRYSDRTPSSFPATPGKHTIRIRTRNEEFTIPGIEIHAGEKLEFSFDPKNPPEGVTAVKCKKRMNETEKALVKKHLLFTNWWSESYFYQDTNYVINGSYNRYIVLQPEQPVQAFVNKNSTYHGAAFTMQPGVFNYFRTDSLILKTINIKRLRKPVASYAYFQPGQLLLRKKDLPSISTYSSSQIPLPANPSRTEKGKGSLLLSLQSDEHTLSAYLLQSLDSSSGQPDNKITRSFPGSYDSNSWNTDKANAVQNLPAGRYRTRIYTSKGYSQVIDSIEVKNGYINCLQVDPKKFEDPAALEQAVYTPLYALKYSLGGNTLGGKINMRFGVPLKPDMMVAIGTNSYREKQMPLADDGTFRFNQLRPGLYNLLITDALNREQTVIMHLYVSDDKTASINITLGDTTTTNHFNAPAGGKNAVAQSGRAVAQPLPYVSFSSHTNERFSGSPLYTPYNTYSHFNLHGSPDSPDFYWNTNSVYFRENFEHSFRWLWPYWLVRPIRRIGSRLGLYKPKKKKFRTVSCPSFGGNSSVYRSRYGVLFESDGKESDKLARGRNYAYADNISFEDPINVSGDYYTTIPGMLQMTAGVVSTGTVMEDINGNDTTKSNIPLLADAQNAKRLRDRFADYAYWQPVLTTDSSGTVKFEATFPDNLTGWRSYAAAMGIRSSGMASAFTKSFKPLSAALALPRFLVEGDTSFIVGKALNYTNDSLEVKTQFTIQGKPLPEKKAIVKNALVEMQRVEAGASGDSLTVEFSLTAKDNYGDGEKRSIPVLRKGVEEAIGQFWLLEGDTTFNVPVNPGAEKIEVSAFDNELDVLLGRIRKIKSYEYECNEQLASKLEALLMEKKICAVMKRTFRGDNQVNRIVRRLEKTQREDGCWGWWEGSPANTFMTITVAQALIEAEEAGYTNRNLLVHTYAYLENHLLTFAPDDRALTMYLLEKKGRTGSYNDSDVEKLEKEKELGTYGHYLVVRIRQMRQMENKTAVQALLKSKQETVLGACYWGEHNTEWYDNSVNLSLLAYRILESDSGHASELKGIRSYFLEPNNTNAYRNTYESAAILETILPAYLKDYKGSTQGPKLSLGGALNDEPTKLPLVKNYKPTSGQVTVKKTGASPLYLSVYERKWNRNPEEKNELFNMKTSFVSDGKTIDTLKAGQSVMMKVDVEVKKKGNYVMIEVPIPAGCSYDGKSPEGPSVETHREAFKNKSSIFCESLPAGNYTFYIKLQPRYTGTYTLNPAKTELMYFPVFYGRNAMKKTVIGK